ncbi:hypothetical protein [Luteimonas sp. MC1750]|uniref:hypothetical protein n=1 Tax=Luteimonas sp. MC1750 TaxID=2799326 RepID=UPI0018F06AA3|nr:hypothetical protein [Luteimonas sp. MC1750]MBJ6983731.1 hypothetical protein [Luteimonas sp. MC1750]QQO06566.1 hypothetical protein JGR68_03770 [Luteimonas sp. MC1750]
MPGGSVERLALVATLAVLALLLALGALLVLAALSLLLLVLLLPLGALSLLTLFSLLALTLLALTLLALALLALLLALLALALLVLLVAFVFVLLVGHDRLLRWGNVAGSATGPDSATRHEVSVTRARGCLKNFQDGSGPTRSRCAARARDTGLTARWLSSGAGAVSTAWSP